MQYHPADEILQRVSAEDRIVFLARIVEEFSDHETAEIIGGTSEVIHRRLALSWSKIDQLMTVDVLILENAATSDEAIALQRVIERLGHSVIGVIEPDLELINEQKSLKPDVVFLGATQSVAAGENVARQISDVFRVPVVFFGGRDMKVDAQSLSDPGLVIEEPFQTQHVRAVITEALLFGDGRGL